jgi:hypothetical protein
MVDTLPPMSESSLLHRAETSWDVIDLLGEIEHIGVDPVRGGYSRFVFEPAELELRAWFTGRARARGRGGGGGRRGE